MEIRCTKIMMKVLIKTWIVSLYFPDSMINIHGVTSKKKKGILIF